MLTGSSGEPTGGWLGWGALPRSTWLPLFGLVLTLGIGVLLLSSQTPGIPVQRVGEVASQTVRAPRTVIFVDSMATDRARNDAAAHIPPVLVIDRTANLAALATVRRLASPVRRVLASRAMQGSRRVSALQDVLAAQDAGDLAAVLAPLQVGEWDQVIAVAINRLRYAASPDHALTPTMADDLIAAAANRPDLTTRQRRVVRDLLSVFLQPNAHIDAGATARARRDVLSKATVITSTLQAGQVIVRSGDVVDQVAVERLQAARQSALPLSPSTVAGILLLAGLLSLLLHAYIGIVAPDLAQSPRRLGLLVVIILATVAAARLAFSGHDTYAYAFPAALAPVLVTVLLDAKLGLAVATVVALLLGQMLAGSFEMTSYYFCGSVLATLAVRKVRRLNQFFVAGILVSLGCITLEAAFRLISQAVDAPSNGAVLLGALISGGLTATLSLGSFGALGTLFGVTTALQLLELSHPDHPLLRRLMLRAPGTYHHSLMIGNLAERAAEVIGADALVARVIAYYHDIGKLQSPTYFAENQAAVGNIHDTLPPEESARLIRQHVIDGLRLARQYHLPKIIQDGIAEHHGLNLVGFFYRQAVQQHPDEPINIREFTYPGPKPQSKETAILMLADGVEAAARAVDSSDPAVLAQVIHKVVFDRLLDGQLDECGLSMRDLRLIERAFATVLQGISHPRIKYPEGAPPSSATTPLEAKA